ncbi:MAG: UDP-N-acetylmuramate--L-alanine ligase [Caldiserica bacterium]|nr:UDP-N-acetylmuramate--L-alanine ligase [Caldisericota bacterium]MDH7562989.1 UDP-N-acetylmuramate--L-alanine ligase [Caldisericota bacterium]
MSLPKRLHLIGIGGTGMSSLAFLLKDFGFQVSGSDHYLEDHLKLKLEQASVIAFPTHHPDHLKDAEGVVISSAIPDSNPELLAALRRGIPIFHRMDALMELQKGKKTIAVAGTHGKGTTTGMIGFIFREFGFSPTFYNGAEIVNYQKRAFRGEGEYFILETDESDGSFLKIRPHGAVITNLSEDHLNFWGSFPGLKSGFWKFCSSVSGNLVLSFESQKLLGVQDRPLLTFGEEEGADFCLREIEPRMDGVGGSFTFRGKRFELFIPLLGKFNLLNALGAIAISFMEGIPVENSIQILARFRGIKRRLEKLGEKGGILIFDDYAHHPNEIKKTFEALKPLNRRIVCVFQPHRYSRIKALRGSYGEAFRLADIVFILPIFSAGEQITFGLTGEELRGEIMASFPEKFVRFVQKDRVFEELKMVLQPGDLLVFIGPGDIDRLSERSIDEIDA